MTYTHSTMMWVVWVDLERPLTADEQSAAFAALEALVPSGASIGPHHVGDAWQICFDVEAATEGEALDEAVRVVMAVLARSGVAVGHAIEVQRSSRST